MIFFVAQHVHKRAVVHTMHSQRPHKISFHQPKRFGEQQRIRRFHRHAVNHFAPKFFGHRRVKFRFGHSEFAARRNRVLFAGLRIPQTLIMFFRQRHRRVKTNHGRLARDIQNRLNHLLAHFCHQIIQLRGVVPRKTRTVVAVINKTRLARWMVVTFEHDSCVGLVKVVVFNLNRHARVTR